MPTYQVVLPDGSTISRNSKKKYSHVIACDYIPWQPDKTWRVVAWCGYEELADRRLAEITRNYASCHPGTTVIKVPVEVIA